jgi:hypothetical protein
MRSIEEEKQEIIEWLMHPSELGCRPRDIKYTNQFKTKDGIECMIFKYKKSMFSPWLLAISSDSGIFSRMQRYNPSTEIEDATKLVEYLAQFWKNQANEAKEREEKARNAGTFAGFALLKEATWDSSKFEDDFDDEWGIILASEASEDNMIKVYSVPEFGEKAILAVTLVEAPVPNGEAEQNAKYNYMWRDAVQVTATHKAHLIVSVVGASNPKAGGVLFSMALSAICRDDNTLGIYYNNVVVKPNYIFAGAELLKTQNLPVLSLVWLGICQSPKGISAYTTGMTNLGKDEIEIVDVNKKPNEVRDFLFNIVTYVLEDDVILHDGETIGVDNTQRLEIKKSAGVNVVGESLKILL